MKRPTQVDVARLAGVSQTTVSLVFNKKKSISLSSETRRRVLDAINELGYVPDNTARSLRSRKTYTIAGIIPDITNPFYPAFERGIQVVAEREGYQLIMYNTDGLVEKERKCLRYALQNRVDGMVATLFHLTPEDLRPMLEGNVSVTLLVDPEDAPGDLRIDRVGIDNVAAAKMMVSYLIDRGHTRIAMITGHHGPPRRNRVRGYKQALADDGIPLDEALLADGGDFTEQGGYHGMQELLKRRPHPTAVFAVNDLAALGAMIAIREAGLRIPQDIAVAGFDNIPSARHACPTLTTIDQFQENLGRRAAEMLIERLCGLAQQSGRTEEMPYELVVRESA